MTEQQELHQIVVNLIPKASDALERAAELRGDSRTDTINRAIQLYAFVLEAQQEGGVLIRSRDGELHKVGLL